MPKKLAEEFRDHVRELRSSLLAIPAEAAGVRWRPGGWTRREILGHMLDSAPNNRQRWTLAAIDGIYVGPPYAQEAWVALHGYARQSWRKLLRWWQAEHEILAALVDSIPEERLNATCTIGGDAPVTLRFLIEDYVAHQRKHLAQMAAASASS